MTAIRTVFAVLAMASDPARTVDELNANRHVTYNAAEKPGMVLIATRLRIWG
ncbi:hypothetical protein [Azospirillum thiophilum]|uniref:hypothetical protein n=1 Tax=Azospirillum thiophilum TaxID=528244 RepID=UPI000AC44252|nr:hypothetical protein [Azospirillum thiophilum]